MKRKFNLKTHKNKIKFLILIITVLMLVSKTYAMNNKAEYKFFITKENAFSSNEQKTELILSNSVNKETLINNKIAPRNKWDFFNKCECSRRY